MTQTGRHTTAGDEVVRLLEAADGNADCLDFNISLEPEHWIRMIYLAVPYLLLNRCTTSDASFWDLQ